MLKYDPRKLFVSSVASIAIAVTACSYDSSVDVKSLSDEATSLDSLSFVDEPEMKPVVTTSPFEGATVYYISSNGKGDLPKRKGFTIGEGASYKPIALAASRFPGSWSMQIKNGTGEITHVDDSLSVWSKDPDYFLISDKVDEKKPLTSISNGYPGTARVLTVMAGTHANSTSFIFIWDEKGETPFATLNVNAPSSALNYMIDKYGRLELADGLGTGDLDMIFHEDHLVGDAKFDQTEFSVTHPVLNGKNQGMVIEYENGAAMVVQMPTLELLGR